MTLPQEVDALAAAKPLTWKKSRHSGSSSSNCVELACAGRESLVRDSKNPNGPRLRFGPGAVGMLIEFVKRDR